MSFSSNIKTELCKVEFKRECCLRAECYGAWLFSRCFTGRKPPLSRRTALWPAGFWSWPPGGPASPGS